MIAHRRKVTVAAHQCQLMVASSVGAAFPAQPACQEVGDGRAAQPAWTSHWSCSAAAPAHGCVVLCTRPGFLLASPAMASETVIRSQPEAGSDRGKQRLCFGAGAESSSCVHPRGSVGGVRGFVPSGLWPMLKPRIPGAQLSRSSSCAGQEIRLIPIWKPGGSVTESPVTSLRFGPCRRRARRRPGRYAHVPLVDDLRTPRRSRQRAWTEDGIEDPSKSSQL